MKILVIGATGTIGTHVARALEQRHEVLRASLTRSALRLDLADPASIHRLYSGVGDLDAVVSVAGQAAFGELFDLSDADFAVGLTNKLMGQVNLVRLGVQFVRSSGSFTLTSGMLSRRPMVGSGAISMVNSALEGFVRAAALELPRGIRVNAVAAEFTVETLTAMGMDPTLGIPAEVVAQTYVDAVEGTMSGRILDTALTSSPTDRVREEAAS